MELADLNEAERIALIALVHKSVSADHEVSEDEADHVAALIEAFTEVEYQVASAKADEIESDEAGLRKALAGVRPEARGVIYGFVRETVLEGGVLGAEMALMKWLEKEWGIAT